MFDGWIRDHARWTPRAGAATTPGREASYAVFDADVDRMGTAIASLGIAPGCGLVSLAIHAPYLQLVALAALARLGVASSTAADHAAPLRLSDRAQPPRPGLLLLDAAWLAAMFAAEPRPLPRLDLDPDAPLRVLQSSGTTGAPHRVALSPRRIAADAMTALRIYGAGRQGAWIPLTGLDSLLGFSLTVLGWAQGARIANGQSAAALPAFMEGAREGVIGLTPVKLRALLGDLPPGFQPLPQWRLIVAGSALPHALAHEAALRLTPDVRQQYGATESSQIAAGPIPRDGETPGLVGPTPAGAVVEVVDEAGRPVPDGQSGEFRVRGSRTAASYVDEPAATAERFQGGWFHTRDQGMRLPPGHPHAGSLVVEGRIDERMIVDGAKFMPAGLEDAALACPGVSDAAAFAVPGEAGLDVCWLAVATQPGFDRGQLAPHLAAYPGLPPPRFAWIDEIPRNAMGKVERSKLREAVIAATRPGGG